MKIILVAALTGLLLTGGHAAAAEFAAWHIAGAITAVNGPYAAPGGPFSVGMNYLADFTVDLTSAYTPSSGVANFEGAIKSFNFSLVGSDYTFTSSEPSGRGVSITPNTPSGDVIYFYLPTVLSFQSQPASLLASFFFTDPTGTLSGNPNLHNLFDSFDTSRYTSMQGSSLFYNSPCFGTGCGSMQMSITSATVAPVPLPPSAALLLTGLCMMGRFLRQKKQDKA
ncbi:MAG: hypothetical protein E8D47_07175 [Nitrospira sp.]|nr:MAG: hypothetical protein E8D47_07175 [Nitrospira sp.]